MSKGVRLNSLRDVRRFMAKIINQLHRSEIEESRGRTLAYMSSILKDVLKESDIEERIAQLEKQAEEQSNGKY
nr:hypothetical protein [uncultured Desulfobacter sp.]